MWQTLSIIEILRGQWYHGKHENHVRLQWFSTLHKVSWYFDLRDSIHNPVWKSLQWSTTILFVVVMICKGERFQHLKFTVQKHLEARNMNIDYILCTTVLNIWNQNLWQVGSLSYLTSRRFNKIAFEIQCIQLAFFESFKMLSEEDNWITYSIVL